MDMPWEREPDKKEWWSHGLPCVILRMPSMGHLCGYVGVPQEHPWHGKGYDERVPTPNWLHDEAYHGSPVDVFIEACEGDLSQCRIESALNVHGGVTYAEGDLGGNDAPAPTITDPTQWWWFGFDCNHSGDYAPEMKRRERERGLPSYARALSMEHEEYRDMDYVTAEVERMADRLARVAGQSANQESEA